MAFSSPAFVFAFLPVVFLLYWVIPWHKGRNLLLLLFSLLFYSAGSLVHLPLLLGVALVNFLAGLWFQTQKRAHKTVLTITVILNIGALAAFKYLDFFAQTANDLLGLSMKLPGLMLPIGISFFTFQGLSYAIDVYREPQTGTKNFLEELLYLSFFPQLIAGPIVKYHDVAEQIRQRHVTLSDAAQGVRRFLIGLAKKLLLADILALAVDPVFNQSAAMDFRLSWLAGLCYTLQIYFDFSGYSDMAIGMGRMFGFRFLENFNLPYTASSIRDFWRRWHISLSSWFKVYVYIPLGGNRKGSFKTYRNLVTVFFLTGLWHGASWTFVCWGLWHGLFSVLERVTPLGKVSGKWYGRAYTFLVVMIGFILFRADTFAKAALVIGNLVRVDTISAATHEAAILWNQVFTPKLLAALAASLFLGFGLHKPIQDRLSRYPAAQVFGYAGTICLFGFCLLRLASASFNPFIYFQF